MTIINGSSVFEWDDTKEQINIKKHGMKFKTALLVFEDENRIEMYDKEHSDDEDRFITIGMINDTAVVTVAAVVYTERGEAIRIISARTATKKEQEMYYYDC